MESRRIFIWGTGKGTEEYLQGKDLEKHELIGFIESKKTKESFQNKKVYEPQELKSQEYDLILVCVYWYAKSIYGLCKELRIPEEKLVFIDNIDWTSVDLTHGLNQGWKKVVNTNQQNYIIRKEFPYFYSFIEERELQASRYVLATKNGSDLTEENCLINKVEFKDSYYQSDYYRFRTFELVANEIIKEGVEGETAEVGVFKGTFARLINAKFCDKLMYLFDTFESFNREEFEQEAEEGRCDDSFYYRFLNTSVESVLGNMLYPEKCVIRKGFFPDTSKGLEDVRYAFVSIDVDFEKSILEGLRYFYPRLNSGGAIFVHDYNNRFLSGVKNAVDTYENEIGLKMKKVPIADEGGTLIIVK